jgi:Zn-dependent protease with chaperone function
MKRMRRIHARISLLVLMSLLALPLGIMAQTRVIAPKNPYNIDKDVQLGAQAAHEVERQMPLLRDNNVQAYVARIGARLAEAIPQEYQHPQFRYSYKVVDVSDVNAFALPGGFTFVNRGLIETAQNEAQLAGVIAHEISHVALRHGTAQMAKAQKYQAGSVAAQILGAVIGGGVGQVVGGAGQMGIGAAFLRFSRDYERQADTLGAQIMANAGYDPHELANMFRILERLGGGKGPEWLSDHPNPGNRYEAINREASSLPVNNPVTNTGEFRQIQARLHDLPRSRSMSEMSRNRNTGNGRDPNAGRYPDDRDNPDDNRYPDNTRSTNDNRYPDNNRSTNDNRYPDNNRSTNDSRYPDRSRNPNNGRYPDNTRDSDDSRYPNDSRRSDARRIESPSSRFRTYNEGNDFRINVPDNWREVDSGGDATFAPEGAYGNVQGQFVYTHGAQVGFQRASSRDLRTATEQFINELAQGNRNLRVSGTYQRASIGNRQGLITSLANVSEITGEPEVVSIATLMLSNGDLFYMVFVAPRGDFNSYLPTFQRIMREVSVNE